MKFFTTEQLGDKQQLTPEGYLVCLDVPIARTGVMVYGPDEVPITPGKDGLIRVVRSEEDVFAPSYIASLNGKSVVIRHPEEDVTPENWRKYTVGVILNPRRGEGTSADLLLADLLITMPEGIELIRSGLREVSCGYQADYDETGIGEGRQYNFIGNHVALVESGRCGTRCSIGDEKPETGDPEMKRRTIDKSQALRRTRIHDEIMKAWKAKDEEGMAAALEELNTGDEETPEGGDHIHVHVPGAASSKFSDEDHEAHMAKTQDHDDRLAALEAKLGKTGDEETEEEKKKREEAEQATKDEEAALAVTRAAAVQTATVVSGDAEAEKELEKNMADEVPEELATKAAKANDSSYLADSFQDTVALAEILCPGIQIPTFDNAATPKTTFDSICQLRRKALDYFSATAEGRSTVTTLNGKMPDLAKMSCGAVRTLFRGAASIKKTANAALGLRTGDITTAGQQVRGKINSIAEWNKQNAEHYGKTR